MGNERYDKEVRQIGGVMMICSLAVMTFPILDTTLRISHPIGDDPRYDEETNKNWILNWVLLAGDLCVVALGLLGMGVGFMAVTDSGSKLLTFFAIIWEQTAFIDWIGKMYELSIPEIKSGTGNDDFLLAMGIIKMIALCFLLYGSLGFCFFTLYAFQNGNGHTRNQAYYKSRLFFYSMFYTLHGLFPFLVQGTKIYLDNKDGPFPLAKPVKVVGQPISHPQITIAMGCLFTLVGIWGMARGLGVVGNGSRLFQGAVFFAYLSYMCLIILTEFSIPGAAANMSSMATVVAVNAHVIVMYLDEKARSMPAEIEEDYYDSDSTKPKDSDMASQQDIAEEESYEEEEVEAEGMA